MNRQASRIVDRVSYRLATATSQQRRRIVSRFHRLYYYEGERTWANTSWLGARAQKCPLDLWIYQEILHETRPDLIVETGTADGGSALFLASILDLLGNGRVITIDVEARAARPQHERIEYVTASSTAPEIVAQVQAVAARAGSVMAILDSDHSREHVLAELRAYGDLVTPGNYLVVEDTNLGGHPIWPDFGPGPMAAAREFLAERTDFALDPQREKFGLTFNPNGFLRKTVPA
jgi:cephalosporin hydroxylase